MVYPSETVAERKATAAIILDSLKPNGPVVDYQELRNDLMCKYMHDTTLKIVNCDRPSPLLEDRMQWRTKIIHFLTDVMSGKANEANSIEARTQPGNYGLRRLGDVFCYELEKEVGMRPN